MSFLNSAAVDQLKNRLEEEQSSSQSVPDAKAPAAEVKQDEKLDAKPFTQDSSSSEGETDEGHQIPYKRFRSLVDTKNELKSKNLELERQLAEFKAQLESGKNQTKSEQASDDDDVDRIFQSLLNDDEDTPDERYSSLEGRLRSFEEKQAAVELEKEMSGVLRQLLTTHPFRWKRLQSNMMHGYLKFSKVLSTSTQILSESQMLLVVLTVLVVQDQLLQQNQKTSEKQGLPL
jgi:hypothetical protein